MTTSLAFYDTAYFVIRDKTLLIMQIEADLLQLSKTVTNTKPRPNEPRRKKKRQPNPAPQRTKKKLSPIFIKK
jgi:hypothetical protein